jgi:hypothetical protein
LQPNSQVGDKILLGVSMRGEKVVKLPEGPHPGFPCWNGDAVRFLGFAAGSCYWGRPSHSKLTDWPGSVWRSMRGWNEYKTGWKFLGGIFAHGRKDD